MSATPLKTAPYRLTVLRDDAHEFRPDQDDGALANIAAEVASIRGVSPADAYDQIEYEIFGAADDASQLTMSPKSGGFEIKRLLEGEAPPPPEMVVDDLILAGDINTLGGDGDAGKSTTLFHIGVHTVIGRPVFGSLGVKRPGPAVLVVPEDGMAVARHHTDAIIAGLVPPPSTEEMEALRNNLHIVGDTRPINLTEHTRALGELMAPIKPSIVILEPIASLIGGASENDQEIAHAVCHNLRRDIARRTGAAILLAGHLRKPGRDNTGSGVTVHDLKGSAGWSNHSRIVWLVSKPKGSDLITYRLAKSNRLQTGLEHQVRLTIEANPDNPAHWLSCQLTDANLGASSESFTPGIGRAINDNERQALEALDDRIEPGLHLSYSAWWKRSGLTSESTFKKVRVRLVDAELAQSIPTGKKTRTGGRRCSRRRHLSGDGRGSHRAVEHLMLSGVLA